MNAAAPSELVQAFFDEHVRDPEKTVDALQLLAYAVWSRHRALLVDFIKRGAVDRIFQLLRPRQLESLPCERQSIAVDLFNAKQQQTIVWDSWPAVIRSLSALVFARLCTYQPEMMLDNMILEQQRTFVVSIFVKMLSSTTSSLERYAGLMALESVASNATLREQFLEQPETIKDIFRIIQDASISGKRSTMTVAAQAFVDDGLHQHDDLMFNMRYRLAVWRSALNILHILCLDPVQTLYAFVDDPFSSKMPLRRHWRALSPRFGMLIEAVTCVFSFCKDAMLIPQADEQSKATVFSGPGLFQGSAIQLTDLTPIIRSALHLLTIVSHNDVHTKRQLMRSTRLFICIRNLLPVFNEDVDQRDFKGMLQLMGIGSPTTRLQAAPLLKQMTSNKCHGCFQALKMLAHSNLALISIDQFVLAVEMKGTARPKNLAIHDVLAALFFAGPLHFPQINDKISRQMVIQRTPLRQATVLQMDLSWKSLLRAYAARVWGVLAEYNIWPKSSFMRFKDQLLQQVLFMLRSGEDLELWGALHCVFGLLRYEPNLIRDKSTAASTLLGSCIRTLDTLCRVYELNSTNMDIVPSSVFSAKSEPLWILETFQDIFDVLDIMISPATELSLITQAIERTEKVLQLMHNHYRALLVDQEEMYALSGVIFSALTFMNHVQNIQPICLAELNVDQVTTYQCFDDANIRRLAHQITQNHIRHVMNSGNSGHESAMPILKRVLNEAQIDDGTRWPRTDAEQSNQGTMGENDLSSLKRCANSRCWKLETRKDAFIACKRCQFDDVYFCSSACVSLHQYQHKKQK